MLSEVAGNNMIACVTSYGGGSATTPATAPPAASLSENNHRHTEASSPTVQTMPIKAAATTKMLVPRNPDSPASNTRSGKLKVQDLNEFFLCFLCGGYKVEATTINDCMHSFCRSCIVKHLEVKHYCPECFHKKFVVNSNGNGNMLRIGIANGSQPNTVQTPRIITSQNLYLDNALSALIYKTVPGLYQREIGNVKRFYAKKDEHLKNLNLEPHQCSTFERILFQSGESAVPEEEPVYVSPDEPISLSLEYNPKELQNLSQINPENIPKIQYLQCPAGVQIRHLEKFLCSKFSITSQDHSVELIYQDSVVSKTFTLMDVVYCFDWKKDAPMRFFYRIFFTGRSEPPRLRMKMVVKDNESKKKPVAGSNSNQLLPHITMRTKQEAAVASQNEKRLADNNKIKLSHIIGSSSPSSEDSEKLLHNIHNNDRTSLQTNFAQKSEKSGEKRKLKEDFEFVDEVTISKYPKGAKSPSSSAMRSPQHRPPSSPKSVTFNDTVQATRIPLITYVNPSPANGTSMASPPNDFKRLRSNDIGGVSSSSPPKMTSNKLSSSTTYSSSASTSTSSAPSAAKNTSTTSFAVTNDSSRITSGTVPDNNSKQFLSYNQQPQPHTSTQLHTSSSPTSVAAAHQISAKQQQQSHNRNPEKFPNTPSAKDETPAIGNNNRVKNSGGSNGNNNQQQQQQQKKKSGGPQEHGDSSKNDFNGNLRHEKNHNVADSTKSAENRIEKQREEKDKYEYAKNIGLKPIHELDKNKDVERRKAVAASISVPVSAGDPSSMLYHKKKKKSKHSKDFPFADVKKKKVDYDLAITSSNVPKTPAIEANGSNSGSGIGGNKPRLDIQPTESLKMKFVKVTTSDKSNAKVMVIPKPGGKDASNGRSTNLSSSSSTSKSPLPQKSPSTMPALSNSTMLSPVTGSKSPKADHSPRLPKLSNFIIKDSSMEIHQIPKNSQPPKKSPSPPSLTITSTTPATNNASRGPAQLLQKPATALSQPPKRTQSLTSSNTPGCPPAKKPQTLNQRAMDSNKDVGGVTPFLQRSYSYDPSVVLGNNYNLPLTPFQIQLATQMMFQKQLQQEWAHAAAKQATANAVPAPAPMVPFFNAPVPQSRSPPVSHSPAVTSSKKPMPPLMPPSSLGKFNPVPNLVATSKPNNVNTNRYQEKPPMVEIVRLPPGLDKVEIPHIPVKVAPKANRPPPPTIPLVKIRRASANSTSSTESGDNVPPTGRPRDIPAVLDLSGKPASEDRKVGGTSITSSQKPLPQLNEISKISRGGHALNYRQQSASVRSVPNPSALALRNQLPQSTTTAVKGPALGTSSMSPSRMSPPAMASFTSKSSNLEKLASKIKEGVVSIK